MVYTRSRMFWSNVVTMEHFEVEDRRNSELFKNRPKSTFRWSVDQWKSLVVDRQSHKQTCLIDFFLADLNPEVSPNYKSTPYQFIPTICVLYYYIWQHPLFPFSYFLAYNCKVFSRFGEKIQDSFSAYIGTMLISSYSILCILLRLLLGSSLLCLSSFPC